MLFRSFSTWFDSPFYHILYQHRDDKEAEKAVDHLISTIRIPQGAAVMDLCCGKGRHAVHLQKAGLSVTGLDLSPASIHACKPFENDQLQFELHDMRLPYQKKQFDFIVNLFTSFGYFDDAGNEQVLLAMKQALKPGGKIVIDFLNVIPVLNNLPVQEEQMLDGINFNIHKFFKDTKIIKQISFDSDGKSYQFQEEVNALRLNDFERYFKNTGFQLINVFGDYDGRAFNEVDSKRLILLLQRDTDVSTK